MRAAPHAARERARIARHGHGRWLATRRSVSGSSPATPDARGRKAIRNSRARRSPRAASARLGVFVPSALGVNKSLAVTAFKLIMPDIDLA
jgi:hypothetical protein